MTARPPEISPTRAAGGGAPRADAKGVVLARIRAALGPAAPAMPAVPREYATHGAVPPGDPAVLDLLAHRLEDYRAVVLRCAPDDLAATVAQALVGRGARRIVVPHGLEAAWLAARWDGEALRDSPDRPLPVTTLDAVHGVVTECAVAIAETGTIALDSSPRCGRRAITLVPDYHLIVVRADQVVASVPEGLARLDPQRPITLISGPSATSDIELDRVEGVHGPRTLDVVIVEPAG
ncbi:MAG TPA: LUD domain-containing protein [Kineosporiaceae bacterium]